MDVYEHPLYERVVDVLLNYGRTPEGITSELAKDWVPRADLDAAQDEIERLISEKEALRAAIQAVLDVHEQKDGTCRKCNDSLYEVLYPCVTVRAITKAIGGGGA